MTGYATPSFPDLLVRIRADLDAMPGVLREPLAAMWAKACAGQYQYLDWINAQCSPLTCEVERLYDWAAIYGVDRLPAVPASGHALLVGTVGAQVTAGTLLRGLNGLDYAVQSAVILGDYPTRVELRAISASRATNISPGQSMSMMSPILGVDSLVTVDPVGLTGGEDEETEVSWRARLADEWHAITTSGSRVGRVPDYVEWARRAHPSVTGALVQPGALGSGTVLVRPVCNGLPDRQPTPAVLAAVAGVFADRAPATADWQLATPITHPAAISLRLAAEVDSVLRREMITSALLEMVLAIVGQETLTMAEIDAAVATVTTQYTRLLPTDDIVLAPGEVLTLSGVSF